MPLFRTQDELNKMSKQDLINLVLSHQHTMDINSWAANCRDDNVYCSQCGNLGSYAGDTDTYQCLLCGLTGCNKDEECESRFNSYLLNTWMEEQNCHENYYDTCNSCSKLLLDGLSATYNSDIIKNILLFYSLPY